MNMSELSQPNESSKFKPDVSIIIPTYNRYKYCKRAIDSILKQTFLNHSKIEIIVVNDKSTTPDYQHPFVSSHPNCTIKTIHLNENSRSMLSFACAGYVRNIGVKEATADIIALVDDDDWMVETRIERQFDEMKKRNASIICSDGYAYDARNTDQPLVVYNKGLHWNILKQRCKLQDEFPAVWDLVFLRQHNTVITSSMMMKKECWEHVGGMRHIPNGQEDYDCWLRLLEHYTIDYIDEPLFIYDLGHGDGSLY